MNRYKSSSILRRAAIHSRRLAIALCLLTPCAARSAFGIDLKDGLSLEFTFTPGVFLTRLNGEVTLGPSPLAEALTLEDDFDLDDSEPAFNFEAGVLKDDDWGIDFSVLDFSTESSGVFVGTAVFGDLTLNDGDAFDSSFDLMTATTELVFWPWGLNRTGELPDKRKIGVTMRTGPTVGVRYLDIDQTVEVIGEGVEDAGGEWWVPYAGMQLELRYDLPRSVPLVRQLEIDAGFGAGPAFGGDGGFAVHFRAGLTAFFTPNFGVGFGYRLIYLDVENDDYEFQGGLQGLFFSGTFRF